MATTEDYKRRAAARKLALGGGAYKPFQDITNKIRKNPKIQNKQGGKGGVGASLGDSSGTAANVKNNSPSLLKRIFAPSRPPKFSPGKTDEERARDRMGNVGYENSLRPPVPVDNTVPQWKRDLAQSNPIKDLGGLRDTASNAIRPLVTSLGFTDYNAPPVQDEFQNPPAGFTGPTELMGPPNLSSDANLPTNTGAFAPTSQPGSYGTIDQALANRPPSPGPQGTKLGTYDAGGTVSSIAPQSYNGSAIDQLKALREGAFGGDRTVDTFGTSAQDVLPSAYERDVAAHNKRVDLGITYDNVRRDVQSGRMSARAGAPILKELAKQRAATYNLGTAEKLGAAKQDEATRANLANEANAAQLNTIKEQKNANDLTIADNANLNSFYKREADQANKDRTYGLNLAKYDLNAQKAALGQQNQAENLNIKQQNLAAKFMQLQQSGDIAAAQTLKKTMDVLGNVDLDENVRYSYAVTQLGPQMAKQLGVVDDAWLEKNTNWTKKKKEQ